MKRSMKALATAATAVALAAAAPAAHAVSPVVRLDGSARLSKQRGSTVSAAVFHVDTRFSTDTPGAPLLMLQRATIS